MGSHLSSAGPAALSARLRVGLAAVALAALAAPASAQVTAIGNVRPVNDPFTDFNEGIQSQTVNGFLPPGADQNNYERGDNIEIGINSFGEVRVLGGADLRYEHLILGGDEEDLDPAQEGPYTDPIQLEGRNTGFGVLRIEQFGSSFNNHPRVVPSEYVNPDGSSPENPRFPVPDEITVDGVTVDTSRERGEGFDAIIGLTGRGELYLNTGGLMEIEDAFIAGYAPQSTGYVEVDGVGTHLAVYGGLRPNREPDPQREDYAITGQGIHQMVIGAYGDAQMRITGGANVDAYFGAAIGVTQSDGDDAITQAFDDAGFPEGRGEVIVDGPGSTWNLVYGAGAFDSPTPDLLPFDAALAIGQFDEDENPDYNDDELGEGMLSIRNDGFVRIDGLDPGDLNQRDARIGRMGTLDFRGGRMFVRDQFVSDGLVQAVSPNVDPTTGAVTPAISRLEVGTFLNRRSAEVRVGAGQTLIVRAHEPAGEFEVYTGEPFIAANFARIEVLGDPVNGVAKFHYDREFEGDLSADVSLSSGTAHDSDTQEVFFNSYNTSAGATGEASTRGQIVARDAELRFRTGIFNSGDIQFIGGDNVVSGAVYNDGGLSGPHSGVMPPTIGVISLTNASHVAFEDPVANDGVITISDDSSADFLREGPGAMGSTDPVAYHGVGALNILSTGDVSVAGNFALGDVFDVTGSTGTGGTLRLAVEDFTRDAFATLVIEGDADFDFATPATIEILELAPPSGLGPSLAPGDEFEFITVLGANSGIAPGDVVVSSLPTSPTAGMALMPASTSSGFGLVVVEDQSYGADFNGDGVVDASDVTVWQQHHGLTTGATGAHGDVDLDGDVDSTDYYYLLSQLNDGGVPYAVTVPEPATLMLALVAVAGVRRRKR